MTSFLSTRARKKEQVVRLAFLLHIRRANKIFDKFSKNCKKKAFFCVCILWNINFMKGYRNMKKDETNNYERKYDHEVLV